MNGLLDDLRIVWRGLMGRRTFFFTAVLTLALGVGAVAAIFTVYDAVLLKSLPFAQAERIVRVTRTQGADAISVVSVPDFDEWRERSTAVFDAMGGYVTEPMNLVGVGDAERLAVVKATPGFFDVFATPLALGRGFGEAEENNQERVVVLGDALWRTRFGSAPDVLGRDIRLNGNTWRVIGVAQPGFRFPANAQLWIPTLAKGNAQSRREVNSLQAVARLRSGVALDQALDAMDDVVRAQIVVEPAAREGQHAAITPLQDVVGAGVRQPLQMLLAAAALVLLIACANLANLMLARGQARAQELALRRALGAPQSRLARHVLLESLLIGAVGSVCGLSLATPAMQALLAFAPDLLPAYNMPRIDLRVIATCIALGTATVLLFALYPAWRAGAVDPIGALRGAGRGNTGGHRQMQARRVLVAGEVALALTLLAGAGLLIGSLQRLSQVDTGLDAPHVLTAQISLPTVTLQPGQELNDWATQASAALTPRINTIERALRDIPGVESAALSLGLPASASAGWSSGFSVVGESIDPKAMVQYRFVSEDYFRTFGVPVEAGRDFDTLDGTRALFPTELLVNRAFAERYLAGSDPLAREIRTFGDAPIPVVGVVGDVRQAGLDRAPHPEVYFPISKALQGELSVAIRVRGDAMAFADPLRRALRDAMPDAPVHALRSLDSVVGSTIALRRFNMLLMSVFAGVALLLSAIGLYGVIAYAAGERRREIGLRQAIGARRVHIHQLMLGTSLRMLVPGVIVGIVGALVLGRLIASQLYGVGAADPLVLAGTVCVLTVVALLACIVPTLRAARASPMDALRSD